MTPKYKNRSKNRQIRLHQNLKLLCIKGHNQQSKKATYKKGENSCNYIPKKELIILRIITKTSIIYDKLYNLVEICAKDLNRCLSKEDTQHRYSLQVLKYFKVVILSCQVWIIFIQQSISHLTHVELHSFNQLPNLIQFPVLPRKLTQKEQVTHKDQCMQDPMRVLILNL